MHRTLGDREQSVAHTRQSSHHAVRAPREGGLDNSATLIDRQCIEVARQNDRYLNGSGVQRADSNSR